MWLMGKWVLRPTTWGTGPLVDMQFGYSAARAGQLVERFAGLRHRDVRHHLEVCYFRTK